MIMVSWEKCPREKPEFWEFLLWLSRLRIQHSVCEDAGLISGLVQGLRILCCHKLHRRSQMRVKSGVAVDVTQACATAPVQPLAWELPYATVQL